MLKLSSSLFNQPVMSLGSGGQIAVAQTPIINPHNLKIIGWWCSGPAGKKLVLLNEDIRGGMPRGLAVNDESALSEISDLVRYKDILNVNFELLNKLVRTKRQKLGKVSDYSYNDGLFVQKLYVARPLRKVFISEDTLIIDRQQILEVTDRFILVNDTEARVMSEEMAPAGAALGA